jgi:hypothetical protein
MLLAAMGFLMLGWSAPIAHGEGDLLVIDLKSGAVCRAADGVRIPGERPEKIPFRAETATFDRIKVKDKDCYFNPGEYVLERSKVTCPSGQVASRMGRIKGTRSGDDLPWCDE